MCKDQGEGDLMCSRILLEDAPNIVFIVLFFFVDRYILDDNLLLLPETSP